MFHIPFEKREYASTQRYSIPGLPCLYLGSSMHVCWEELRRADLNSIHASKFEFAEGVKEKFRVLYFGINPKMLAHEIKEEYKYRVYVCKKNKGNIDEIDVTDMIQLLETYTILWPLIAACSIKVENTKASFKPEYIIPQLLLQWITISKTFEAISYFSVNASHTQENYTLNQNLVIPIKNINGEGYCSELSSWFKLTESVPWQIYNINMISLIVEKIEKKVPLLTLNKKNVPQRKYSRLETSPEEVLYFQTQWGMYEQYLDKYELNFISKI